MKIYLAIFYTGKFDCYQEHILKCFNNYENAELFANTENEWLTDNNLLYGTCTADADFRRSKIVSNRFGGLTIDHTGAKIKITGPYNLE